MLIIKAGELTIKCTSHHGGPGNILVGMGLILSEILNHQWYVWVICCVWDDRLVAFRCGKFNLRYSCDSWNITGQSIGWGVSRTAVIMAFHSPWYTVEFWPAPSHHPTDCATSIPFPGDFFISFINVPSSGCFQLYDLMVYRLIVKDYGLG